MKKKAIIVSGYFNPIHKGHLEYFHNAKAISEELFVIVNSDFQRKTNLSYIMETYQILCLYLKS